LEAPFIPGQRWLSDTDPELGVGTLVEVAPRRLKLLFPAVGESRIYALPDAPLTRLRLQPGDRFRDLDGGEHRVTALEERDGLYLYRCEGPAGEPLLLDEQRIDPRLQLNRPREKLLAGRLDDDLWFDLRRRTWEQRERLLGSPVHGLVGPRIRLLPHQLHVAREVAGRFEPRALLADEVGLGKTIEAGLVLHRLLVTERIRRVLVVVPASLLHQWLVEMLRRFNLRFSLYDAGRFAASDRPNPFLEAQRVLCSLEFLLSEPRVARAVLEGEWDMVVVDEAHHLQWTPEESSLEYDLVEALARQTPGCLLLSGTPEQLGRAGHFARLRLLDPERYRDYQDFLQEERRHRQVADLVGRLVDGDPLSETDEILLEALLGRTEAMPPERQVERLLDLYGPGRGLFRNSRAVVGGFPRRRLHLSWLPWPERYARIGDEREALHPEHGREEAIGEDPRAGWLVALLERLAPHKVLLICAHAETVLALQKWLRERHAIHAAVFHEGMEIVERDRAAAFFAGEEGSRILLCSEIGSEGRNFQFARHLVLFDLPVDADLLEQRIGRLDRIGQGDRIHLHLPLFEGGPQPVLFRWYHEGLDAFRRPSPAAPTLQERFGAELLRALADPARTEALLARVAEARRLLEEELEAGRDRLLELHSANPRKAAALAEAVRDQEDAESLAEYLRDYWAAFGVEQEPGPGGATLLHPGDHMLQERFPGLPAEGATATFDREDALAHEDRLFLTWEHPMVRGAMEQLVDGALGAAAFTVLDEGPLPSGTLLLELLFVVACSAPAALEAHRFLPPSCLRLVLDRAGNDHAARLPPERLRGRSMHRERATVAAVMKSQSELLRRLMQRGEALAEERAEAVRSEALAAMRAELGEEIERLSRLAVGEDEESLLDLTTRRVLLEDYLRNAGLRLEGVRLIVRG